MQSPVKLLGYMPDVDPVTPGAIVDCNQILPTLRGYRSSYSPTSSGLPALAAACQGAAVLSKLDGTTRLIAGTGVALYESTGTSWTTVTRAAGGAYALGSDVVWSYAQFNNTTLATAASETLQFSVTGAFANVTGAPKASFIEVVNEFVLIFGTNEGIYGDSPNRWWCAAQGNYTDWTPSVNTNCYTGSLFSSTGKIKGAKRFGDNIVVYKDKSMYIGFFAGSPTGWKFTEVPGATGALSNDVIINVGLQDSPKHIFMGYNDFYMFDGSRPVPLGTNVLKETVYAQLNRQYSHVSKAIHDVGGSRVYFYYPSSGSVYPDKCVVFNYKTNTWGRDDRQIETTVNFVSNGISYDGLGTSYTTYDNLPNVSYDAAFLNPSAPIIGVFDTNHNLKLLNGVSNNSYITTFDFGDDSQFNTLTRIKPRFLANPSSANVSNYYRNELGNALVYDTNTTMFNNRFDVIRDARWHRAQINFVGDFELTELVIDVTPSGYE